MCSGSGTELLDDLRACLVRFKEQGGAANVSTLDSSPVPAQPRASGQESRASSYMRLKLNPSAHAPCSSYFDADLRAQVESGFDAPMYDAFGWQGCCGVRDARAVP